MSDFDSPNISPLVQATLSLWKVCAETNLEALDNPTVYPEYGNFIQKLDLLKFDELFQNPVFKSKLFVSHEAEYCDVFKNDHVHIMLIFMPPKMVYPIHDHPGMLVLSKVLKGQAIINHFDIVDKQEFYANLGKLQHCRLKALKSHSNVLKENELDIVLPEKGNLHSIDAVQRTVILDVMFNYYDDSERPCSFFTLGKPIGDDLYELFYHKEDD
jgi:hypothetical protein